ncbi:MAG TPA: hypothetical protein VFA54_07850 [Bryobacterales bacterium]|nr:hypothetical protein [Bryobacterales bacterium]
MPGAGKKPSRKSVFEEYIRANPPAEINRQTLAELRDSISQRLGGAAVSERYLLELIEHTAVPISRELGGLPPDLRNRVRFHDFASAEASLYDLQKEYEDARRAGDRLRAQDCRRAVLRGRQRLELLLRRPRWRAEKRAEKIEILGWFRVWLENPELFRTWLELRKRAIDWAQGKTETGD